MSLPLLPEEILELIVDQLSVKDLLACSAVSLEWRETFNNDVFWKKLCIKGIKDYLENTQCQVEPSFVAPEQHEERLQPLCSWRIHFMRNVHLLNNWNSGRYSLITFRRYAGILSSDLRIDCEGIHWLFIRTATDIEIWNINTVPQLFATVPMFARCPRVKIFVVEKRAIIIQWNIVSVYDLQDCKVPFKTLFRFALQEESILPAIFWNLSDKTKIVSFNEIGFYKYLNFGNLLVGYKRIINPKTELPMHIWDVTKGEKVKIESMFHTLRNKSAVDTTALVKIDDLRGLIYFTFNLPLGYNGSQLYMYNFKKQMFTDTDIMCKGVIIRCGCSQNIIVLCTRHENEKYFLNFYNLLSGELLSVKEFGETQPRAFRLVGSYLLYSKCKDAVVLDLHKQEVIVRVEFRTYCIIYDLTMIESRFVVVWSSLLCGRLSFVEEVWDINNPNRKLIFCSERLQSKLIAQTSSIVKQVIRKNSLINLYSFW